MIEGYSKLSKDEKRKLLIKENVITESDEKIIALFEVDPQMQKFLDDVSENVVGNYFLPFSVVPNVVMNNKTYWVPMVTEESSVVAAASYAAKFWAKHSGFHTQILGTEKIGQIHFFWKGDLPLLQPHWEDIKSMLISSVDYLSQNMKKRGGGITDIEYFDNTHEIEYYHKIHVYFRTADAMGANYINSCLEVMARELKKIISTLYKGDLSQCEINMAILSNYTPECLVDCTVECKIDQLDEVSAGMGYEKFVDKFSKAIEIARIDVYRAVTHNKGIYNGIDAVVLATGNDFRAVEACGHAYASRNGKYESLSRCDVTNNLFRFSMRIPIAVGTIGGLTRLHPLADLALKILGNPSADELMQIAVTMGMANHFAAIRALVTTGIQKGHMKMHLTKILQHLQASPEEQKKAVEYFQYHEISFKAVEDFIYNLRMRNG